MSSSESDIVAIVYIVSLDRFVAAHEDTSGECCHHCDLINQTACEDISLLFGNVSCARIARRLGTNRIHWKIIEG